MWDHAVGKYIKNVNRSLFLVNAVILGLLLWWAFAAERYLSNCWMGPEPISAKSIETLTDPGALRRPYVSISHLPTRRTGLRDITITRDQYTEKETGRSVTATYFAALSGSRYILISSPDEQPSSSYKGELKLVSDDLRESMQTKVLGAQGKAFDAVFYPVMLDASNYLSNLEIFGGVFFPVGLLALFNVIRSLIRMRNINATPSVRAMAKFPEGAEAVAMSIDHELETGGNQSPSKAMWLTQSWLVKKGPYKLDVVKISEIRWIYQKVVKHSVNAIPTGKSHGVMVGTEDGRLVEFLLAKSTYRKAGATLSAQFLKTLMARAPWAVVGYSDELKRHFKQDRSGFFNPAGEAQLKKMAQTAR